MSSKYGNKKVYIGGEVFDSQREYNRWCELLLLQRAGKISGLRRQPRFLLIPAMRDSHGAVRATYYIADFIYTDTEKREVVVEDAKGFKTDVYKLKKKMMLDKYHIEVQEV